MASTKRSHSPPQKPPLLRDPFSPEINSPPRNHLEERTNKRRCIEELQDKSLIHGFQLQQHALKILESKNLTLLQELIQDYTNSKNKQSLITIFKSFSLHYPNAFSFKLVKILQLNPSLQIRTEIVSLLLQTLTSSMSSSFLIEIKNPLLQSLKLESEEILFPSLCETVGLLADRLYVSSLGGWDELLEFVFDCITGEVKSNNKKGLMLLTEFPVNKEFWMMNNNGNFDLVFSNILEFIYSTDKELKDLAYNASISLMLLSKDLKRMELCDILLPILLSVIDQHGEEEVLVIRVKRLGDLVNLGDRNILRGKYHEVFWCMIRVAEIEDASKELVYVAGNVIKELSDSDMNVMENLIESLSCEEVKRVIVVGMNMLSCVVEDPVWYDVDNEDSMRAGMTLSFYLGVFLFNLLTLDANKYVFVPTAIEMITEKYVSHVDWQVRHGAMIVLGWIVERNFKRDMMEYLDQVARLVLKSLDDEDPQVVWATMHAIKGFSEHKYLLMHAQYHKKFLAKLVPIIRCNSCVRLQSYAVISIRCLVKSCGLDKISPFGETIVASLLVFLKHEAQKLHIEAIDTLKSFAVLMPGTFRQNYYDTTMEALKVIVFDKYSLPRLLLCAKCLEFMVYLVTKVGPGNFKEQEAVQLVESLISVGGKLSNTDFSAKCVILEALDQICRCPRVSIDKFINKIMPMLLGSAQPRSDLIVNKHKDDSLDDGDKNLVETMTVRACNTLSYCAVRSYINFSPYLGQVSTMFMCLLGCSSFEIRKASILGLPNLLLSLKVGDKNKYTKRCLTFSIVRSLIVVLKENDRVLSTMVLKLLARCIQTSRSFFNDTLIKIIADEINNTIRNIIKIEIEKAQVRILEGRCASLPTEDTFQELVHLIETTIDSFKDRFMLHVDDLMSNAVVLLADDMPDRVIGLAISIFNVILPLYPVKMLPYHDRYKSASCFSLRNAYPCSELHATRAIGICAMFGGDQFKASARESILILYNVMSKGFSTLRDTAVAALGKICEFHSESINLKVVQSWLNFLPLKHEFNEARYAHGLLSKLIKRSDEHLFGSNYENLPKVIYVVKQILSGPDRLGTMEAIDEMIEFIDQHGGMEIETGESSNTKSTQAIPFL